MKNTSFLKKILLSIIGISPVKGMENDNGDVMRIPVDMGDGRIEYIQLPRPRPEFRNHEHVIHIPYESDRFAERLRRELQEKEEEESKKLQELIEKQQLKLIEIQKSIPKLKLEIPKLEVIEMPELLLKPITIQDFMPVQEEIQEPYQESNAMELEQQDKFNYRGKRFDNSATLVMENKQKDNSIDSLILQMNEQNQRSYVIEQELFIQNQTNELKKEMEQMQRELQQYTTMQIEQCEEINFSKKEIEQTQLLNAQHEEKIKQEMNITIKELDAMKIQVEKARARDAMLMLQANSDDDVQQPQSCCCIIF